MLEKELTLGKGLLEKAIKRIDERLLRRLTFYYELDPAVVQTINCFYRIITHVCDNSDYQDQDFESLKVHIKDSTPATLHKLRKFAILIDS